MTDGGGRVVLRAGAATDVGRLRPNNQDSYAVLPEKGIYVVADGMGGAQGGEVASRMAIETIAETYTEPSVDALTQVIAEANERIHAASERPNLRGMGTTTVAIALVPDEPGDGAPANGERRDNDLEPAEQLLVVNVGDSRAYLFRDGGLTQLTDDHSVVAELVRDGHITAVEAEAHPQRNIITRVLGVYPEVRPDIWPIDPIRGDRYLLCSDGLFNEVTDDQMSSVLRRLADPTEAATELVRLANEGGGRDNITVIVLDVVDDGGAARRASAALAGEARGSSRAGGDDLAGFSTAIGESRSANEKSARRKGKAKGRAKADKSSASAFKRLRSRLTWRVLVFTLMLAAVVGGAFATIQWYGTSTYYVGFHGDEVAIYQGRPGGLLWIDATLEEDTAIKRDEVPALYLSALKSGHEHSSLADARAYVSRIERDIIERSEKATTTTTTPPTTAAPPSTAAN